nr:ankyrin repeat and SOCS box protein 3-like [Penaeus vannamei]
MRALCVAVVLAAWLAAAEAEKVKPFVYDELYKDPCDDPSKEPPRKRNSCNGNAILLWASKGKHRRVKYLLKQPDTAYLITYQESRGWRKGYTALLWASEANSTRTVMMLLDAGSIIDHRSYGNFTAVYLLAENNNLAGVTRILEMGADPNVVTAMGYTALFMATWNGQPQIVKVLLDHNANPNFTTPNTKYFPLYIASKNGHKEIVEHLLDAYANFNMRTSWAVIICDQQERMSGLRRLNSILPAA